MAALLGMTVCIFLAFYMYFAVKNPDALRSEKYTLSKMAIEKNLIGDDKVGLQEVGDLEVVPGTSALPYKQGREG
jgi:hypothetical protein